MTTVFFKLTKIGVNQFHDNFIKELFQKMHLRFDSTVFSLKVRISEF